MADEELNSLVEQVQAAVNKVQENKDAKDQLDAERASHANTKAQLDAANQAIAAGEAKLQDLVGKLKSIVG